ncbi:MAG: putative glycoside hydrolase [Parcubacteria group bacterium]
MGRRAIFGAFLISLAAVAAFLIFGTNLRNPVVQVEDFSAKATSDLAVFPAREISNSNNEINVASAATENIKLSNPPEKINAVYATSWSAGSSSKIDYLLSLIKATKANALVIDIKDFSGRIAYATGDGELSTYEANPLRIKNVEALVNKLHSENVYAIARIVVFQDPVLALARPDLAIKDLKTGETWKDNKGLAWVDPASQEVWDYNAHLAKNAFAKGFDEVNFDYVRFPSDGSLDNMSFPFYDESKAKQEVIKDFFGFLRESLEGEIISVDLFGLVTSASDDMGIGQHLEDAYGNFDFICPMVYPSHFASGFIGFKDPAAHPYEVVKYSGEEAVKRLTALAGENKEPLTKLRPWLQDFSLGYTYGSEEVKLQIQAVEETSNAGWMLWDPRNNYTKTGFSE